MNKFSFFKVFTLKKPPKYPFLVAKIAVLSLFGFTLLACDGPVMTESDQMEVAERAYQRGQYTEALNAYEQFLKHYQSSPLAPVAKQRILTINREVSTIMRRKGSPSPEYLKKTQ